MMPATLDIPPTMWSLLTAIGLNKKEHNVFILYYFSQFLNTFFIEAPPARYICALPYMQANAWNFLARKIICVGCGVRDFAYAAVGHAFSI